MVKFPKKFVQLDRFPGYYWNTEEKHLYSIKVTGVLRKLTFHKGFIGYARGTYLEVPPGYQISKDGHKRHLSVTVIENLVAAADKKQKVPVEK